MRKILSPELCRSALLIAVISTIVWIAMAIAVSSAGASRGLVVVDSPLQGVDSQQVWVKTFAAGPAASPTACAPAWHAVTHPDAGNLTGLAAISANDVYAVGSGGILHWDGAQWSLVHTGNYSAVAALTSTDVWVWGSDDVAVGPKHWDGTTWTRFPSPISNYNAHIYAITMGASNRAWATGEFPFNGTYNLPIYYWDGTSWINTLCCLSGQPQPSPLTPQGGGCEPYSLNTGAMATGPDNVWMVGTTGSSYPCSTASPTLVHCVDGTCQPSSGIEANQSMSKAGPSDLWSVGTLISNTSQIARYTSDGAWSAISSPNIAALLGVSGSSPTDVWAVGAGGFLHYNGAQWSSYPTSPAGLGATAVASISVQDAWAITGATILHYDPAQFTDVPADNTFYANVRCLYCRGIVSGYACGGNNPQTGNPEPCDSNSNPYFRYNNPITRGQITKLVSNAAGYTDDPGTQQFQDIAPGSPFYTYVNRLIIHAVMGGYACGGAGEPCVGPGNLPYFRPGANALRGQLCKIASNAAGFSENHTEVGFQDVPASSPFYQYIQRLVSRSVLGGYACGGAGEACVAPGNLPYFRPGTLVSRGQSARIAGNALIPNCQTP
ncbi:MAG: S-layer homology domain-containing protein [Chloroflexota bacterium]|nr:S-layer homology domain-containing protein [Chloroflexota bacterium]